jgi:hypothetical protein
MHLITSMTILKYLQLPFYFDAFQMQHEVNQLIEARWMPHFQTLHYEGGWSAIPLRSLGGKADNIFIAPTNHIPYEDTVFLSSCKYFQKVLQHFKCQLKAVRLLKLNAGSVIKEHRDAELCFEKGEIRIHIPVITNDEVEFYLDNERMFLKEGECWYMNFNLPHSISNKGKNDRIHLVVDAIVNDWVKELFDQPGLNRKIIQEPGYDDNTKRMMIARFREMNSVTSNRLADEMEDSLRSV